MIITDTEINDQLGRITKSKKFLSSRRMPDLLSYLVEKAITGKERNIKQYTIAVDVYERPPTFDPKSNPLIRIEIGRLRRALKHYYDEEGRNAPILIEIPVGSYKPKFTRSTGEQKSTASESLENSTSTGSISRPVIAVFPFINHSKNVSMFIANGLGEEITGELSRCRDLDVIAFNSTAHVADLSPDVIENAQRLGANYAISGTLQESSQVLRICVNVLDVENKTQIWRERFEVEILPDEIFKLEDSIVSSIISRISDSYGVISRDMSKRATCYRGSVTDPSVYLAILQFLDYQLTLSPESYNQCIASLRSALEKQPNSATVCAMYSQLLLDEIVFGFDNPADTVKHATDLAKRAVSLNPRCQYAQHALAFACLINGDRSGIIDAADRLLKINPNGAFMIGVASFWLNIAGEYEKGMHLFEKSIKLNPFYPAWFHVGPYFYSISIDDFDTALHHAKNFTIPGFFWAPLLRAVAFTRLGKLEEARSEYLEVLDINMSFPDQMEYFLRFFILDEDLLTKVMDAIQKIPVSEHLLQSHQGVLNVTNQGA